MEREDITPATIPAEFWFLRDRASFPFVWRIYAAWKMLVDPNNMSAAFVLFAHARMARTATAKDDR